jgi:hypothetical protein
LPIFDGIPYTLNHSSDLMPPNARVDRVWVSPIIDMKVAGTNSHRLDAHRNFPGLRFNRNPFSDAGEPRCIDDNGFHVDLG